MEAQTDQIEEIVVVGDRDLTLLRPRESTDLIDEDAFADDEFIPYWADLWPSAILLAQTLARRALRGARVLELGAGLGLPSLAAALAGGRVMSTDWAPDAVDAAANNAERNGIGIETLVCDWRAPDEIVARGPWDLVIAADVLYERRNVEPLLALLGRLDAETWLADPGRVPADQLMADLELIGWTHDVLDATERPRVTVHRLRPGRMSEDG